MKTKLSKRLLSLLLAVMMIVTSIPMMAVSAFAEEEDSFISTANTSMGAFESLLATPGKSYTNVDAAYTAYVAVQKALDRYQYGSKNASERQANSVALIQATSALDAAVGNVAEFVPVNIGKTVVPTFDACNSGTDHMKESPNGQAGYNNVLYAPQATRQFTTSASATGSGNPACSHSIWYGSDAVLLWDGTNDTKLPVMVSAIMDASSDGYSKERFIWSAFPANSSYDADDGNWKFDGVWNSGNSNNADWHWNWWAGTDSTSGYNSHALYNYSNGHAGLDNTAYKSGRIPQCSRKLGWGYTYSQTNPLFMANVLRLDKAPTGASQDYNMYWYVTTGGTTNGDYSHTQGSSLHVVNYEYLINKMAENGAKMKSVALDEYSEGGLQTYINAMEAASDWNPMSFFNNGATNGYNQCVNSLNSVVDAMDTAPTDQKDSADYQALRDAMDLRRAEYNDGVNNGYTDESWAPFVALYEQAAGIMANVTTNGYTATNAGTVASDLAAAVLVTNVSKVDTSALQAVINQFYTYKASDFTAESYAAVVAVINTAKSTIWQAVSNYPAEVYAPDDSAQAQSDVADQVALVTNAIKGLRISMDAVILSNSDGRASINEALALKDIVDADVDAHGESNFGNLSVFTDAYDDTMQYVSRAANTEFTNYEQQMAEYTAEVNALYAAYHQLSYAFTKIPNGTVCGNNSITSMTPLTSKDQGYQEIKFGYNNSAIILKTSRHSVTVPFGKAVITFGTNIKSKINNGLDSISIHATQPEIAGQDGLNRINNTNATADSTPKTGDAKNYPGCVSYNGFSISDIRITDMTANNSPDKLLVLGPSYGDGSSDGNSTTSLGLAQMFDLTSTLATTDATQHEPSHGEVFARSTNDECAYTYLEGDFNFTVPESDTPSTDQDTEITATTYSLSTAQDPAYFGAVSSYNCQNVFNYAYFTYVTSASVGETINANVTVIDMTPLVKLVNDCNTMLTDEERAKYTTESWSRFTSALNAANEDMNYQTIANSSSGVDTLKYRIQQRYDNLWKARYSTNPQEGLVLKPFDIEFNYKNERGTNVKRTVTVDYGSTIANAADYSTVTPAQSYVSGPYTYTFNGWDNNFDANAPVKAAATYTAQYIQTLNKADFERFEAAQSALISHLCDDENQNIYSVADLQAIADTIANSVTYYHYTAEQKAQVMADVQDTVDAQAQILENLLTEIQTKVVPLDISVAKTTVALYDNLDIDIYDVSQIRKYAYTQVVDLDGVNAASGVLNPSQSQAALDATLRNVINNLNEHINTYNVYLTVNGGKQVMVEEAVPYGTTVTVNADANGSNAAWTYSYDAPSREGKGVTIPKYMLTAPSIDIVINGDVYLTADIVDEEASTAYTVTVKADIGNIIKVQTLAAGERFEMPQPLNFAYYRFDGYSNGLSAGDTFTVTGDVEILANYSAISADDYVIDVFYSREDWMDEVNMDVRTASYNQKVNLSSDDAYCWVIAEYDFDETLNYRLLAYGSKYSFFACHSYVYDYSNPMGYAIVAFTQAEYNALVLAQTASEMDPETGEYNPVYVANESGESVLDGQGNYILGATNGKKVVMSAPIVTVSSLESVVPIYKAGAVEKFSMIGTYTIPENYELVECGFLFTSKTPKDGDGAIIVENVGKDGIARMKASKHTVGNQFVINIYNPATSVSFTYVPYVIAKAPNSDEVITCYGTAQHDNNTF